MTHVPALTSAPSPLRPLRQHRLVWVAAGVWVGSAVAILLLARGTVPFDQPWLTATPYGTRIAWVLVSPVFALMIIPVVFALTYHRSVDVAKDIPGRATALRETVGTLLYGGIALAAGQWMGRSLGLHGLGLHLTGSMFGLDEPVETREVFFWSGYNFVAYAVLPYLWFRRRGYSNAALCLRSGDRTNDLLVTVYVLMIGLAGDLPSNGVWSLRPHQIVVGGFLSFVFSLLGTGIPIMVFLTAILVPRYRRLTGSTAAATILGGCTYASLHVTEYWTRYDSPSHAALSLLFILLTFGPPGMVKAYLTQRTGNAWVHLWGYHAIWPHVTDDTVVFVSVFGVR